ncbi:PAS domain-containing protein [Pikeienuella piscinae]|uniref:PAS domain-containing protein n=1 Tax=Pikeienuella piscinae TaxID=2748098 RepID=A0A7L5BZR2_9RHOB|nr:PAS domain S-box protein [Pikeienuella piscinae]QIE55089.1 PAS domain-containing protein [Pikeienuella piscinae]
MNLNRLGDILLRDMPDALVVSDRDGVIRFWNAGATRIFGFTREEALNRPLDIIIPEAQRARHNAGYRETMRTGKTKYGGGDLLAVPAITRDGRRISIQFSITPLRERRGAIIGVAAILRDVTAEFERRKALEKRLARECERATGVM